MTVVDNVFPQSGDADFAENFAMLVGRGNISDYVETGLDFTVDYAASPPTVDISQGKGYVIINEETISSTSETRLFLDYTITTANTTGIALNADETNNLVYLNPNVGTNDSPTFEVETTSSNAGTNWLLVGVIDTVNNTSEVRNRNPDADFDALTTRDSFGLPVYSDFADASASQSSTIFIDGNGTPRKGVYVYDGAEYISVGIREINELLDVDGVESVTSDVSSNRPAAGTQGRLFIDETNNLIQLDTGSSWVDIGTNASNIGAGDLGFDPATQTELNDHASLPEVHHSPPTAGDGLKNESNNFNIEPTDFAGSYVSDDGTDNIQVNISSGLEGDGSDNIRLDEDYDFTFTSEIDFNAGLRFGDSDADTNTWSLDENATSGNFAISESATGVVTDVDSSGNIRTEGTLTEGASL